MADPNARDGEQEELDALLSQALREVGAGWSPRRPPELTRVTLLERLRRRHRTEVAVVVGAAAALALVVALGQAGASGSNGLVADPSLPAPPSTATRVVAGAPGRVPPTTARVPGTAPSPPAGSGDRHPSAAEPTPPRRSPPTTVDGPPAGRHSASAPPGPTTTVAPTTTTTNVAPTTVPTPPTTAPSPPSTTTTTTAPTGPTTTLPQTYTFTNADDGRTVTVPLGSTIDLDVTGCLDSAWRPVRSSAPSVVVPESTSAVGPSDAVQATLRAVGDGRAVLRLLVTSTCVTPGSSLHITVDVG